MRMPGVLPVFLLVWAGALREQPLGGAAGWAPNDFLLAGPRSSLPQAVPLWKVDEEYEVSIGAAEGPDESLLYAVRDATALSDGTLVVAMFRGEFFELRYYSPEGVFITSAGRFGEGPFEVSGRGWGAMTRLAGDSILIVGEDRRYSVFGPRGERARSGRLSLAPFSSPVGFLDETHLGLVAFYSIGESGELESEGIRFLIQDLEADSTELAGSVQDTPIHAMGDNGLFLNLPFPPEAVWTTGGGFLWYGTSDDREIRGQGPGGGAHRAGVRLERSPKPVTKEDQERWKEFDLGRAANRDMERQFRRHHGRVEFPETLPLYQTLHTDETGNLWVLRYEPPLSEADFIWDVFAADGSPLAQVRVPFGVLGHLAREGPRSSMVLEIGADYFLVQDQDGFGVERVRKYRLHRAAPS